MADQALVQFSLVGLHKAYCDQIRLQDSQAGTTLSDVEDALLYLSKIGAMRLEGGFLVLYNGLEIKRLILDNKIRYKQEDYKTLNEYYRQKIQQIHIVGEYANLMVRDYDAALQFVQDYLEPVFTTSNAVWTGLFPPYCVAFSCNTQSIPAKTRLVWRENPSSTRHPRL